MIKNNLATRNRNQTIFSMQKHIEY